MYAWFFSVFWINKNIEFLYRFLFKSWSLCLFVFSLCSIFNSFLLFCTLCDIDSERHDDRASSILKNFLLLLFGIFTDAACGQSLIHGGGFHPVFFYDLHVALQTLLLLHKFLWWQFFYLSYLVVNTPYCLHSTCQTMETNQDMPLILGWHVLIKNRRLFYAGIFLRILGT